MKRLFALVALCGITLLGACSASLTPTQTTALVTAGTTLAAVAAQQNSTVAEIVQKGALLCGQAVSPTGVLIGAGIVAVANVVGIPVSVTGALANVVAGACPAGLVPGALPAATDPTTVPVQIVPTTGLPAVS